MVVTTVKRRSPGEEQAAQLRDAAEAGRADEVAGLLAKGRPPICPTRRAKPPGTWPPPSAIPSWIGRWA